MGKGTSVQLPEVLLLHKGSRPLLSFSNGSHAARCRMLPTVGSPSPTRNLTTCQHSHETKLQGQFGGLRGSSVFLQSFECLRLCGTCVATEMPFGVGDLREWPSSLFICHIYRAKGHPNLWPTLN
ncbi:unnamed protein product [Ixodes persulcatus]